MTTKHADHFDTFMSKYKYDETSPTFVVHRAPRAGVQYGAPAGTIIQGERIIKSTELGVVRRMQVARFIWRMHHGIIPDNLSVGFKDDNPLNCHIDNLFLAPRRHLFDYGNKRGNSLEVRNLCYNKKDNRYFIRKVNSEGKRIVSPYYKTKEEAMKHYDDFMKI